MIAALTVLIDATLRMATALAWPALGETLMERTGTLNISLEASVLWGALGGLLGALALGDPWGGVALGAALGLLSSLAFGLCVERGRLNAVLAGTGVNLIALGGTGFVYREMFGRTGTGAAVPLLGPLVPNAVPLVGPFLSQSALFVLAGLAATGLHYFLFRTQRGLTWRACGEDPRAAADQGIAVTRVRLAATAVGGAMAGVGGAFLVVAATGVFVERMSAGRGFMALAIVALGRWRPGGVWLGALLFGLAGAAQFFFQALGTGLPYHVFLMLPYVLTLAVLALRKPGEGGPAVLR